MVENWQNLANMKPQKPQFIGLPENGAIQPAAALVGDYPGRIVIKPTIFFRQGRIAAIEENHTDNVPSAQDFQPGGLIERPDLLLTAGLINAHVHFELSWLLGSLEPNLGMSGFIARIIRAKRQKNLEQLPRPPQPPRQSIKPSAVLGDLSEYSRDSRLGAIINAIQQARVTGTVYAVDIANGLEHLSILRQSGMDGMVFLELLGLTAGNYQDIFDQGLRLAELNQLGSGSFARIHLENNTQTVYPAKWPINLAPHAPYSLSYKLQQLLANYLQRHDLLSSIHFGESVSEKAFLAQSPPSNQDFALLYADLLGPQFCQPPLSWSQAKQLWFRPKQLLVHGIELEPAEIDNLAAAGCRVVLCPRSNRFIHGKMAPYQLFRHHQVCLALGTDSLASNTDLDMFAEMVAACDEYQIEPLEAWNLATWSAARALDIADLYGSINQGKLCRWLGFAINRLPAISSASMSYCPINSLLKSILENYQEDLVAIFG